MKILREVYDENTLFDICKDGITNRGIHYFKSCGYLTPHLTIEDYIQESLSSLWTTLVERLPNGLFLSQIKKYCQNWFMNDIFDFIRSNAIFKISNTTYRKLEEIKREIKKMEEMAKDNKVDAKTVINSICSSECVDNYLFLLQNYNKPISLEKVISKQDDKEITIKDTLCDANDSISFEKIFLKDLMQRIHQLGYTDEELERLIDGKYLSYGEKKRLNDLREYCKNWVKEDSLEDEINLVIDTPKGVKCCYRENKGNYLTSRPEAYKRH